MYSLIYKSKCSPEFNSYQIQKMLSSAQNRNREFGISGCLLYYDGNFVQLIEGEKKVVKQLYRNIKQDTRHKNVTTLSAENTLERLFENWEMLYCDLSQTGKLEDDIKEEIENLFHKSSISHIPSKNSLVLWRTMQQLIKAHKTHFEKSL